MTARLSFWLGLVGTPPTGDPSLLLCADAEGLAMARKRVTPRWHSAPFLGMAACVALFGAAPAAQAQWRTAPALDPVGPGIIAHVRTQSPVVALTFDLCQTHKPAGYDAKIVQILKETRTPATFFAGGRWMDAHRDVTQGLAGWPDFEIGNHSYLHPHLIKLGDDAVRDELRRTQDIAYSLTGKTPRLFRCPFGEYNAALLYVAATMGLTVIQWDVETGDPDPNTSAAEIIREVKARTHPGSIIIMHANGRGWHSAEALPDVIRWIRAQGWWCVKVSDLLKYGKPLPPR
jgi:peptidoglycan/xylan/chitin deacetylase (PgdA/CDA1 family)